MVKNFGIRYNEILDKYNDVIMLTGSGGRVKMARRQKGPESNSDGLCRSVGGGGPKPEWKGSLGRRSQESV
jgi:hypothetical protein